MANLFLKVNKDLFKMGLNPTEILILAQIIEYNTNTGDCFISDKTLAEQFGVSESTIKREIKKLDEEMNYIIRETKNVKGGKERHLYVNNERIKEELTSINLNLVNNEVPQSSNCPLSKVNLILDKEQNDTIKDNIKDKEKDKRKESGLDEPSQGDVSSTHPVVKRTKQEEATSEVLRISTNPDGSFKM